MRYLMTYGLAALSLALASPAAAQSSSMSGMGDMQGMNSQGMNSQSMNEMKGMGGMKGMAGMQGMSGMEGMSPMQHEQMMAMQRMNEKMMAVTDPNPDRAFAKKMMAHHEGAIAMSEIELRMGKDAEARRIAEKTIAENRAGVSELQSFLARH